MGVGGGSKTVDGREVGAMRWHFILESIRVDPAIDSTPS